MFGLFKKNTSYENINAQAFKEMLSQKDVVVLDVRTNSEYTGGKIKGAQNIDVLHSSFASKISKLDKNKTYLVYCRSGARSANACSIMSKNGFEKLYNLSGGILSWRYPLD